MFGKSCNLGSSSFNANPKIARVGLLYNAKKMRVYSAEFIWETAVPRFTRHSELFELAIVCMECITNLRIRVIDTDPLTFTPGRRYPTGIFGNKKKTRRV